MSDLALYHLHAVVSGFVQGVGFRAYVAERAGFLSLTGWVRNTLDGDVEVSAEGPRSDLDTLLAALRKGPRGSQIIDVRFEYDQPRGEYQGFKIRSTV
jgi:acylphosphatase